VADYNDYILLGMQCNMNITLTPVPGVLHYCIRNQDRFEKQGDVRPSARGNSSINCKCKWPVSTNARLQRLSPTRWAGTTTTRYTPTHHNPSIPILFYVFSFFSPHFVIGSLQFSHALLDQHSQFFPSAFSQQLAFCAPAQIRRTSIRTHMTTDGRTRGSTQM